MSAIKGPLTALSRFASEPSIEIKMLVVQTSSGRRGLHYNGADQREDHNISLTPPTPPPPPGPPSPLSSPLHHGVVFYLETCVVPLSQPCNHPPYLLVISRPRNLLV